MSEFVFVYATFPEMELAETASAELVADHLAACANLLPGVRSVYSWQGAVERASEVVAIFKTRAELADAVMSAIKARHPYEVPALVVLPVLDADAGYAAWLRSETVRVSDGGTG
jgi:periplasmic divalent cation tolerance protein